MEFVLEGKYKTVRDYLEQNKVLKGNRMLKELKIKGIEALFTNNIADYFASWIKRYMLDVLSVIGDTHSIGKMVDTAFVGVEL